jgi:tRNA nucleotidyltransferase (CCA-adding enzyme)
MAKDENGTLVDPFGGRKDLDGRVLRHVSEAFSEDPVRILRVARFAARFDFRVAEETAKLMSEMVRSGEADYLVPERVWQELSRGLGERYPARMLEVLAACGLLAKLFPGVHPDLGALARAAAANAPITVRFALLVWPLSAERVGEIAERLKLPNDVRELAVAAARHRPALAAAHRAGAEKLLQLLKRADAFRRGERFAELLQASRLADPSAGMEKGMARLERALAAAAAVDAGAIAAGAPTPAEIPRRIDQARLQEIEKAL